MGKTIQPHVPKTPSPSVPQDSPYAFSYLELRRAIGILAISLPMVLYFGAKLIFQTGLQPTVSGYYYTQVGNVFVGVLFAIGFFLLSYKGLEIEDRRASFLASLCAIVVALFPTHPAAEPYPMMLGLDIGTIHYTAATGLFLTLAYFCLFLFTKTGPGTPTPRKLIRNQWYRAFGLVMILCIVLIGLYSYFWKGSPEDPIAGLQPVFWLESVMIVAFSASWLMKGELILADQP